MPVKEKVICVCQGVAVIFLAGYVFYDKILAGILFLPYLFIYYKKHKKQYQDKRKRERVKQFKDGMMAVNSALAAGYSVENSFKKALTELRVLYGNKAEIIIGFEQISYKIGMNHKTEDAIDDFARQMGLEDAAYFAEVFRYAKRSGGDMTAIIRKTTENINGRLEVNREIDVLVTGRRMEQKVMNMVPFGIILYIRLAAKEFIAPLYGNLTGMAVMTACLFVYLLAIKWAEKIIDIEV